MHRQESVAYRMVMEQLYWFLLRDGKQMAQYIFQSIVIAMIL